MSEFKDLMIPVYDQELENLLRSTKVTDILKDHPIIAVKSSEFLPTAFKAMIDHKILSLPVFDATEAQVGFIDIIDIMYFLLKIDQEVMRKGYDELTRYEEFKFKKVGDLLNFSGRNSILKVSNDASLWTAMNAMIDFGDLHRVPIVNRSGETVGLLAQFDILHALVSFIDENDFGLFTVRDFQLGYKNNVFRIKLTQKAKDAFTLMKDKNVSAVAVVTEDDKLYGNLSATDLKSTGFDTSLFSKLTESAESYMKLVPPHPLFGLNPIFVRPSDSLRMVFRKFVDSGVHRLYVVQDTFEIVGVISLIDILRQILACSSEKNVASPPPERNSPASSKLLSSPTATIGSSISQ